MTKVYDLDGCVLSNLTYGGNAGSKLGIVFEGDFYMLKFPKNTRGMREMEISYTTSPMSEYLGSKIYEMVGVPVHDTKLGVYDGKLVVICKDIEHEKMQSIGRLSVFGNMQNVYNENTFDSYSDSTDTKINKCIDNIKHNYIIEKVGQTIVLERFWTMFIIDTLLNNNDRNNGNWGFLVNGDVELAPVFDNGNSFSNKFSEAQMMDRMDRLDKTQCEVITSVFRDDEDKPILPFSFFKTQNVSELNATLKAVVPRIKIEEICAMIDEVPTEHKGIKVLSDIEKAFIKESIKVRLENIIIPAFNRAIAMEK